MTGILLKRGNVNTEASTQGEQVNTKAEIEVMNLLRGREKMLPNLFCEATKSLKVTVKQQKLKSNLSST